MDDHLKQLLTKWNNLDTNVESPLSCVHAMSVASEVIDALVDLVEQKDATIS